MSMLCIIPRTHSAIAKAWLQQDGIFDVRCVTCFSLLVMHYVSIHFVFTSVARRKRAKQRPTGATLSSFFLSLSVFLFQCFCMWHHSLFFLIQTTLMIKYLDISKPILNKNCCQKTRIYYFCVHRTIICNCVKELLITDIKKTQCFFTFTPTFRIICILHQN